jgi:hypothetical protein
MRKFYYGKKGYPRWRDSNEPVHRTVAENKIGRPLKPWEVVHHRDDDKGNFRRENLGVMSRSFHSKIESKKRKSNWW